MWSSSSYSLTDLAGHLPYWIIVVVLIVEMIRKRHEILSLRNDCSVIERKNDKLERRNDLLEKRMDSVGEKNDQLTADNNQLSKENFRLQSENSSLELMRNSSDSNCDALSKRLSHLELQNSQLEAKNSALERTVSDVEFTVGASPANSRANANDVTLSDFELIEKENETLRAEIDKHKKNRSAFERKINDLDQVARNYESSNSELLQELDRLKKKNRLLKAELDALKKVCEQMDKDHKELQNQHRAARQQQQGCTVRVNNIEQLVLNTQLPLASGPPSYDHGNPASSQAPAVEAQADNNWTYVPRKDRTRRRRGDRLK